MISLHYVQDGKWSTAKAAPEALSLQPHNGLLWINLARPKQKEIDQVNHFAQIQIPSAQKLTRIEASDQLYRQGEVLVMTVQTTARHPETGMFKRGHMTFFLTHERLVTLHSGNDHLIAELQEQAGEVMVRSPSPAELLLWLLDELIERLSANLHKFEVDTEVMAHDIFGDQTIQVKKSPAVMAIVHEQVLRQVGRKGNHLNKHRQCLVSYNRALHYLAAHEGHFISAALRPRMDLVLNDIKVLTDHVNNLSQSITFLLDAVLGMINMEQNKIVRTFTVIAFILMPPTLVGTVYGMNFELMPELKWPFGYPLALTLMILSALIPYWISKRRHWF